MLITTPPAFVFPKAVSRENMTSTTWNHTRRIDFKPQSGFEKQLTLLLAVVGRQATRLPEREPLALCEADVCYGNGAFVRHKVGASSGWVSDCAQSPSDASKSP